MCMVSHVVAGTTCLAAEAAWTPNAFSQVIQFPRLSSASEIPRLAISQVIHVNTRLVFFPG